MYTADAEYVLDKTIDELERSLPPDTFLPIHRSVIINLSFVRELTTIEGGRFAVALTDTRNSRVFASPSGVRVLRERLQL